MTVNGIKVTNDHPFLKSTGEFILASQAFGCKLVDYAGELVPAAVDAEKIGREEIFNFEVEDLHTYVAGGLRVHNISLKLDGSDGYVHIFDNGDMLGTVFNGNDSSKIIDYRPSDNYARALGFTSDGLSDAVWSDLASLTPDSASTNDGIRSFNKLVGGGLPRTNETQNVYLKYYQSDLQKIAEVNLAGSYGTAIGITVPVY